MNQLIENTEVQNIVLFKSQYRDLVQKLVPIRKAAGCSQKDMAEWLKVDKRKIMAFENLKKIELEILLKYADKLSTAVSLNYQID